MGKQEIRVFKAGFFREQGGFKSFFPEPINCEWVIDEPDIAVLLSEADLKLGELSALSRYVPEVDFFIEMYITKEATTSSRIEGTQTSIEEAVLSVEDISPERRDDWREVQNYIRAMNFAVDELSQLPLSTRLLNDAHRILLESARGEHKLPGEFRRSQNWIGGASPKDAVFVPPPHTEVHALMSDLEQFLHNDKMQVPLLIRIAIAQKSQATSAIVYLHFMPISHSFSVKFLKSVARAKAPQYPRMRDSLNSVFHKSLISTSGSPDRMRFSASGKVRFSISLRR